MNRLGIAIAVVAQCLLIWPSLPSAFQTGPFPDFDEDGVVGFADFLQFAGQFGSARGDDTYDDRFDLDGDGSIGFPDFLIFVGSFGKASPYAGDENDVNIPDANLRAAIADSLGMARDTPITRAEMATLSELRAHDAGIKDLTGLQFATNLESLWLTYNPLSDLSPLCDLTSLKSLVLFGNTVSDLSPLSGLINLTHLNLNDNRVSDLSALADLKKLTHLWLLNNKITNFSVLSGLTNLVGLEIGGTGVTELSVLAGLNNLTELGLSNNDISDISAVSGLINLKYLDLSDNCVSDLSALTGLSDLTFLNLNGNRISAFSPLTAGAGIGSGDQVDLRNNPSSLESINIHIPGMLSNGVDVQFDLEPELICIPIRPDENSVDAGSSHTLQSHDLFIDQQRIRSDGRRGHGAAVAYADFNDDGHVDVFYAPSEGHRLEPTIQAELYLNDGTGCFTLDTSFLGANPPGRLAPRKALPGDFNGDGRMDVFVLDHGYDKPPFPGAAPYVILSSGDGCVLGSGLESLVGFQHGGASADIDGDGDIDVFVTHLNRTDGPFFLMNDGTGTFSLDEDRVDGLAHRALFTAELVDVDGDGFLDLLAAGHEYDPPQDLQTQILWGDADGLYSTDDATTLPAVPGRGIVVDIDVSDTDGDGDSDIIINRTGDERTSVYEGYYLQLVEQVAKRRFEDRTVDLLDQNSDNEADWIVWIRMCDCDDDGDVDIVVDDAARKLIWKNDGTGAFLRR